MWECSFTKEPFDLKLMFLRLMRYWWIPVASGILGAALAVGGYYLGSAVFASAPRYEAVTEFYIEYGTDPHTENVYTYINEYTWNMWVESDVFTDAILEYVERDAAGNVVGMQQGELTKTLLKEYLSADTPADWRIAIGIVETNNPELTMNIRNALEKACIKFGEDQKEIEEIKVINRPEAASQVKKEDKAVKVGIIGAFAAVLLAVLLILCAYTLDDSVVLPAVFEYRYHVPMLGTLYSTELKQNFAYLFRECKGIAVTASDAEIDLSTVCAELTDQLEDKAGARQFTCIPSVEQCPEAAEALRKMDGRLLVVEAGKHDGKRIEHTLQFMEKQNCAATAALLIHADEKLLKLYYKTTSKQIGLEGI